MIKRSRQVRDYKALDKTLPTLQFTTPIEVFIHLQNNRCKTYDLFVKEGDKVKLGEVIAMRHGGFFEQPVHSTVSGVVGKASRKFHRTGRKVDVIQITNDFHDTFHESVVDRPDALIKKLTQAEMVEIVKDKGLVGLGGSGFPTYIKLGTKEKIDTVVVNAVECEPYLSSDYRMILQNPGQILEGLKYIMQALGAKKGLIAIKSKKTPLSQILNQELKTRYSDMNVEVAMLGNHYPQGWEIEMFKWALGIEIPHGELPTKYGVVGFNVSTTYGIYNAIKHNLPVYERHFTVNGDAVKFPQNIRVRVGTSVKKLIEISDGYDETQKEVVVVLGGPMMGTSVVSDDVVVSKTTTSVLVFKNVEYKEEPCVRCGSCVYSCPVHIEPVQIMNAVKRNDKDAMKGLEAYKCIECGLCTYVCTSKIHVTDYVRKAKIKLG